MNKALSCYREFSRAYIDDIAIFSKKLGRTSSSSGYYFNETFRVKFHCESQKCAFGKAQIKYLGHIIGSELVYPLTELTKKRVPDSIPWTEKHDSSFHLLKKALVEAPSLYSPVPDKTVYHSFRCIANWHSCLPVTKMW
ncbi:retrovirus-related Pol polyprotein from transposon 17.6 [Trichonephila clavipes]|nr:retrovirus-related Pol polyprotein from transposon 17.6 [Trichonephila clavipes]